MPSLPSPPPPKNRLSKTVKLKCAAFHLKGLCSVNYWKLRNILANDHYKFVLVFLQCL